MSYLPYYPYYLRYLYYHQDLLIIPTTIHSLSGLHLFRLKLQHLGCEDPDYRHRLQLIEL